MQNAMTIVVPVYNEVGAAAKTVRDLAGLAAEVIVVDDGSTDGTGEALAGIEGIRVIRHAENRGYGAALKTGIRAAQHPWVAITDADGTYPSEKIPELLHTAEAGGCAMAVGARTGAGVHISPMRRPAKWLITRLASYLSGRDIPDLNSGLRVFRKDAANRFMPILPDGFSFTTTITLAMLSNDYGVDYVPIPYAKRTGKSKIRPVRDTLMFIQLIVRMVMTFNPLRVFVPMSLLLFAGSFASLVYRFARSGGLGVLSIILFMAGIQVLTTGMIADLLDRRLLLESRRGVGGGGAAVGDRAGS